jgi:hypothetical protein
VSPTRDFAFLGPDARKAGPACPARALLSNSLKFLGFCRPISFHKKEKKIQKLINKKAY